MSIRVHYFKTHPAPFGAVASGAKTYEIRKDDRDRRPEVGDLVILREWRPMTWPDGKIVVDESGPKGDYTGRELRARVTYLSDPGTWGLPCGLYVFALRPE